MDWAQVLVIILSVFLAIFLLLGIILTALLIKVTKEIKDMTESANRTVNQFEHIVTNANKLISPVALSRMIFKQFGKVKNKAKKEDSDG